MHIWLKKCAFIAAMLMAVCGIATACPDGRDWQHFSSISFTYGNAGLLTFSRFSDGTYAKVEDEKSTKEMYQLNRGLYLYKGYDPSKKTGPSPFFMLDMPVGIVLNFLAQYFMQPCSVGLTPTPFKFAFASGTSTINVSGSAHRVDVSTLIFDLTAAEQKERGANTKATGKLTFFDIGPVPPDTHIADWVIVRSSAMGTPAEPVVPNPVVETMRDLGALIHQRPKQ